MNLNNDDLSDLFLSAVLHDIGKIATPQSILEFPGKLSPEQMGIMKHHVNHSKRIIHGHAPINIEENVYHHHEKLNGKGYPAGINADKITLIQRILTVADITSALNDSRSYKKEFSTDKTISIITEMTNNGELDPEITKFILNDFEAISAEQKILHEILKVDFSNVLNNYNNYVFNNTDFSSDNSTFDELEAIEDLEEL